MATEIAKAYVQIVPSADGIKGSLESTLGGEAQSAGKSAGGQFSKALGGTLKAGVGMAAALGTAIIGTGTALTSAVGSVAEYGDNIDKMSQKMGLSATAYQEWSEVMKHSGTSMETMKASMKTLANAAQTDSDAFKELGLSQEQIANMSQEELFGATITALQEVDDVTQRTYLSGKLLGRGATELGALLNTSAEDTQKMKDAVHDLGGIMSDEAVKNSAAFQDALQDMNTAFTGLKNGALAEFLPWFTEAIKGITDLITGDFEGAFQKLSEGFTGIAEKISSAFPSIMQGLTVFLQAIAEIAPELITTLGGAIIEAIPTIIPIIGQLVQQLVDILIQNLPMIIQAGFDLIVQLGQGIAQALPELVPQIVNLCTTLIQTILDNLPMIINTGIDIVLALVDGILQAIPQLIEALPQLIQSLVNILPQVLPKLVEGIVHLIESLVSALPEILQSLAEAMPELIATIIPAIVESIPLFIEATIQIVAALIEALPEIIGTLVQMIPQIFQGICDGFIQAGQALVPIFQNMFAYFENVWKAAPAFFANIWNQIKTALAPLTEWFSTLFTNCVNAIKNVFSKITDFFKSIWDKIKNVFSDAISKFAQIGSNIVAGIKNGISNAWNNLVEWFTGLFGDLIGIAKRILGIESPSKVFRQIGEYVTEGFNIGLNSFGDEAIDKVGGAMNEINGLVGGEYDIVANASATMRRGNAQFGSANYEAGGVGRVLSMLEEYLPGMGGETRIVLEGDAKNIFSAVRTENNKMVKSTGYHALA